MIRHRTEISSFVEMYMKQNKKNSDKYIKRKLDKLIY